MARMSLRGFMNIIESKTYARINVPSENVFKAIINELRRNNITCNASIEMADYRFKKMESDERVLFLSERGLFTLFVVICSVGNYTQVQIISRNVSRRYSFEDANHSMEYAMHNLYINTVKRCINNTIERIASLNKWSCIDTEESETEPQ